MEAVLGLLIVLLPVSQGVENRCDGRKDGVQCYGALGGTVFLQLMDDASKIPRYEWGNKTMKILNGRYNTITSNNIEERSLFTPSNGTFEINNLNREDSSNYTLTLFDKDRKKSAERTLILSIQAPVTSAKLNTQCLPSGEKRISCSPEGGERLQYSWTLDGRTLTDDELVPDTNQTNSVTLKLQVLGKLLCWVHNDVSNVSGTVELNTCGFIFINCNSSNGTEISQWLHKDSYNPCVHPTTVSVGTLPILAGVLAALVILIVVALAIRWYQKKKQHDKTKEDEGDHELTYADVSVVQQTRRQEKPCSDVGVEYGQVKFSERPRQTEARTDDCVYSEVRKAR